jgi:type IV fimbrial biogenesis protein FimT
MKGYSLIELMICLALAGTLCTGVVVGLGYWQARAQMTVQLAQLKQDILMCQQSARRYGEQVILCPSKDGLQCDGDWSSGRLAFYSQHEGNQRVFFHILRINHAKWLWQSSLGKNDRLIFKPSGDNLGQQGSFYYCPMLYEKKFVRRVIINQLGRVYERLGQADDC